MSRRAKIEWPVAHYLRFYDYLRSLFLCFAVEVVNTTIGQVCDFEEHECGFDNAGDIDFVSWTRTSRLLMPSGDMQLLELTPSQDSTYHSVEGTCDYFIYWKKLNFVAENVFLLFFMTLVLTALGHYAFVLFGAKMDTAKERKVATYNSNALTLKTPHCVAFYYRNHQIRNSPKVMLSLRLVFPDSPQSLETVVWESNVDHGKKWMAVKRTVSTKERFVLTVSL